LSGLARPDRCAVPAASDCGQPGARTRSGVLAISGLMTALLALTACAGGAIGAQTPMSNGQNFVGASYQATFFKAGSRTAAPQLSGTTVAGQPLTLASYRGQVVVLNFWGSWCAPCRAEAPILGTLASQLARSGVRFVGIDIRDEPRSAQAFMQTFRIGYPSLSDPGDELALLFRTTVPPAAIPSTIILDRTGKIAARIIGEVSYPSLKSLATQIAVERP
jgi:thiol-disulfide isomerase/thioredoxin